MLFEQPENRVNPNFDNWKFSYFRKPIMHGVDLADSFLSTFHEWKSWG